MKVSLRTYGGQAATINLNRPPHVVDSEDLDDDGKKELQSLVSAATRANAKSVATSPGPGTVRDAMSYAITIEGDGKSEVLEATNGNVPEEFAELRNFVRKHQRP